MQFMMMKGGGMMKGMTYAMTALIHRMGARYQDDMQLEVETSKDKMLWVEQPRCHFEPPDAWAAFGVHGITA